MATDPIAASVQLTRLREFMSADPRRDKDKALAAKMPAQQWSQYKIRVEPSLSQAARIMAALGRTLGDLDGPPPAPWTPGGALQSATPPVADPSPPSPEVKS